MGTRFRWPFVVLAAIPVTLVAQAVPDKHLAQSERPITTQGVVGRPSIGQDDLERESKKILQAANSWRTGDPLPPGLRRFREYGSDIPTTRDSSSLIAQVRNLPLLAALVLDSGTDPECREDAFSQGVEVGGPNRFFDLLRAQLSSATVNDIQPWANEVRDRMSRPHAVVDALSISDKDMPRQEALTVIGRITNDLRGGVPWSKVYEQYSEEFSYPPDPKTGDRTKIGLLGPLVVFPDPELGKGHMATITSGESKSEYVQWQGPPSPRHLWRLAYFDPAHLLTLLKANVGDVISLRSKLYREYVLYQVQEIYRGDAEKPPQ